jgi:hypothetical protein
MLHRTPRRPRPAPLLDLMGGAPAPGGMSQLRALLSWKLLKGSHEFPGPAGGTCIIEAAIVAAGREYTEVESAYDFPEDFSWPLGWYLMRVNDWLPDEPRQRLIRFVPRLPGSADTEQIEDERLDLIVRETIACIVPLLASGRPEFRGSRPIAGESRRGRIDWAAYPAVLARQYPSLTTAIADRIIAIADAAFAIGKQAPQIDPLSALVRLESARPQPPRQDRVKYG